MPSQGNEFGQLISQTIASEGEMYWHHYDAVGSTVALTDSNEVVTDEYDYEAFGETAAESGATPNPYLWVAREGVRKDEETGLYDFRRRNYSAATGRFQSEDPIRDDEENLYRYVKNQPTQRVDPSGLQPYVAKPATKDDEDDIPQHIKDMFAPRTHIRPLPRYRGGPNYPYCRRLYKPLHQIEDGQYQCWVTWINPENKTTIGTVGECQKNCGTPRNPYQGGFSVPVVRRGNRLLPKEVVDNIRREGEASRRIMDDKFWDDIFNKQGKTSCESFLPDCPPEPPPPNTPQQPKQPIPVQQPCHDCDKKTLTCEDVSIIDLSNFFCDADSAPTVKICYDATVEGARNIAMLALREKTVKEFTNDFPGFFRDTSIKVAETSVRIWVGPVDAAASAFEIATDPDLDIETCVGVGIVVIIGVGAKKWRDRKKKSPLTQEGEDLFDLSQSVGAAKAKPIRLPANARSLTGKKGVEELFRRLKEYHGIDPNLASKRLHALKAALGYAPDDQLLFDLTGNVFDPKTREWLGSLTECGARGGF